MANQLGPRQWHLDTATPYGTAGSILWNANLKVNHIQLSGYSAQGNRAIMKDQNGFVIMELTGAADLQEVRSSKVGWINGFCLDTLDAGFVTVYLD